MCVNRDSRPGTASRMSRRFFLASTPIFLAGCMSSGQVLESVQPVGPDPYYVAMYGAKPQELFPLPATDITKVDERFFRQQVDYHRSERPGTLVVDTNNRFLYLVQEGGKAMRYGIGVGKAGLEFEGTARVGRKAEWPRWTPTQDMIARDPERYAQYAGGMEPGLENPLGPRALYLFQGNNDTLYRIHGTSEPWSIGLAVSSGCIRLFNQDIIDLYNRVPTDSIVVVLQNEPLLYPQRETPEWVARQINPSQPQVQPVLEPDMTSQAPMDPTVSRRPAMDI
jgi:lipoprotein-anchoring transpeptidase ErfK/SrfK